MSARRHLQLIGAGFTGALAPDGPGTDGGIVRGLTVDEQATLYGHFLHGVARSHAAGHRITLAAEQFERAGDLLLALARVNVGLREALALFPPITDAPRHDTPLHGEPRAS